MTITSALIFFDSFDCFRVFNEKLRGEQGVKVDPPPTQIKIKNPWYHF